VLKKITNTTNNMLFYNKTIIKDAKPSPEKHKIFLFSSVCKCRQKIFGTVSSCSGSRLQTTDSLFHENICFVTNRYWRSELFHHFYFSNFYDNDCDNTAKNLNSQHSVGYFSLRCDLVNCSSTCKVFFFFGFNQFLKFQRIFSELSWS